MGSMTITTSIGGTRAKIDWTKPVLWLFAACLVVLIVLPLSWLALYSVTDRARHVTLQNFVTLFTDPDFLDPLLTTAIIATTSAFICCVVAAPMGWLVSRTDMPGRQFIRALVTASFVTPPFLGAVAWELLAAPNSGLLNQLYRFVTGADSDDHLFNIYSMIGIIFVISCYTFPFVFVLVANALDTMPGELEDASAILGGKAWTTARRVTLPLALPALMAGSLIAFLQAMTLFGPPALVLKTPVTRGPATATLGTVLALVIAYVTTRRVIAGSRVLGFLATAPVAVPGIVLGVGLFLSYTRPPFVLYGTLWILLIAFLTINLPSAYQQLQAAFTTIHPELEDASRILGATRLQSLRQITAPLLRTGVIATWCFIFIGVMRELSAAIILFTSQTKVLSVLIYDLNESGDLAAISVFGIAMLVITFAVVLAVNQIPVFGANAGARLRNG